MGKQKRGIWHRERQLSRRFHHSEALNSLLPIQQTTMASQEQRFVNALLEFIMQLSNTFNKKLHSYHKVRMSWESKLQVRDKVKYIYKFKTGHAPRLCSCNSSKVLITLLIYNVIYPDFKESLICQVVQNFQHKKGQFKLCYFFMYHLMCSLLVSHAP